PDPARARADLEAMVDSGVNALRTYVPPPPWFLDAAHELGLWVMAGLAWEQHVAFLADGDRAGLVAGRVADQVRACEAHPAILCYALGNEIPSSVARWHGKRMTERFLERLHWDAKAVDPEGLFTYVNYPSTEYLELPFLDLVAFNVFLEDERTYGDYLARLQNLSGDRPLLVTEVGLDSRRNGLLGQARAVGWQVRHAFGTGAAGVFVFSWTDEWHRGGHEVTDWDFGLVDRERRPKPSLSTVREAFAELPFPPGPWPKISVVVCTHNGERTLPECLARIRSLAYPDFELIVVCDGSRDRSAAIAREHDALLIETDHRGLSHARNAGIDRASGEIVAFLDDDAYPDADWLHYVASSLRAGTHAGVGGPNVPPPDDGLVAECVAAAPGGPIHVLVSDREAEHVPGCNMAFRKSDLEEIGGFDERFRVAGDDVDLCWRLQRAGRTLGFCAGAVVMHRRRDSVWGYLRQQYGYGKAEALLERKWPDRYNRAGGSRWSGRIYAAQPSSPPRTRGIVRYGTWGRGLFQSIYDPPGQHLPDLLGTPEGLLGIAGLGVLAILGAVWHPLLVAAPVFAALVAWIVARAVVRGWRASPPVPGRSAGETMLRRGLTSLLFLTQPVARLGGRLRNGLSPWRRRARPQLVWPRPRTLESWSQSWFPPEGRIQACQDALAAAGGLVRSGGPFDRWDLAVRVGPLGGVRIRWLVEEHGAGRQLSRVRLWPLISAPGAGVVSLLALLAAFSAVEGATALAIPCAAAAGLLLATGLEGTATAMGLAATEISGIEKTLVSLAPSPAARPSAPVASRPAPGSTPAEAVAGVLRRERRRALLREDVRP
ncbi:MAG: glycosyltransferase, partial [Syntrophothermus sp.]